MTLTLWRLLAVAAIACYLALGVVYSLTVPLWENFDEPEHMLYVRHIATEHSLPQAPLLAGFTSNDEGGQAPLYYLLSGLLVSHIDMGNLDLLQLNPFRTWADHPARLAMFEHTQDENYPWQRVALAGHLARLFSIALGAVALVCTYFGAKLVCPEEPALPVLSVAILGLNPGFIVATSAVNNDAAVAATGALVLLLVIRSVTNRSAALGWWIGGSLGLALLSKANALPLLPFAFAPAFWLPGSNGARLRFAGKVAAATFLVSGWWYAWNWWEFGELFRKEAGGAVGFAGKLNNLAPSTFGNVLALLDKSFWGFRGWIGIEMPSLIYVSLTAVCLAGLLGFALSLRETTLTRQEYPRLLAATASFVFVVAVLYRAISPSLVGYIGHARFLLPAASSGAAILAFGLLTMARKYRLKGMLVVYVAGLGGLAAAAPFLYILPDFPPQLPVWRGTMPSDMVTQRNIMLGEQIALLGYHAPAQLHPGADFEVTLFWRAIGDPAKDYTVFVHVLDSSGNRVAQSDGAAARGIYPTSRWHAGEVVADTRLLKIGQDVPSGDYRLAIGMYGWPDNVRLPVVVDGRPVGERMAIVGHMAVEPVPVHNTAVAK